jgi:hypothetical protein
MQDDYTSRSDFSLGSSGSQVSIEEHQICLDGVSDARCLSVPTLMPNTLLGPLVDVL